MDTFEEEELDGPGAGETGGLTIAGINALAAYTNLGTGYNNTYAVKKENFKHREQTLLAAEPNGAMVQLWSYDPVVLAKGRIADPFSVWLTLQDHPDERVQIGLEEMVEAVL